MTDLVPAAFGFSLVLARIAAAMMLLPGLGETGAPAMLRAGLALALTLLLLPAIAPGLPPPPSGAAEAVGMIAAEIITGLWFGWLARLVALALPMAAQFIAYLAGISSVLQPDPQLGGQSTAVSHVFDLGAPLIILVSGLYRLPLLALAGLYDLVPAGRLLPAGDGAAAAARALADSFALALRLAAPFVLAGTAWNLATGLLARLVPRMQIYFVALPGQILGGLLLLAMVTGGLLAAWETAAHDSLRALPGAG